MQTVWEGEWTNTFETGLADLDEYGLRGAFAHDPMTENYPVTMRMFETNGTPWSVILDRDGEELYSGFSPNSVSVLTDILDGQLD